MNQIERMRNNLTRLYGPPTGETVQAPMPTEAAPQAPAIGSAEVRKASTTLNKYRDGKASVDARAVANQQWWKLRHWEYMSAANDNDVKPASSWLFNLIMSKHADALDAYPEPNVLPREPNDRETAKTLSSVLPVVIEQNDFEITYDKVSWQKLIEGTGIYGVFWDSHKLNGLGDIAIQKISVLNIFWEPGIDDIQRSRNVFTLEAVDKDLLKRKYAGIEGIERVSGHGILPDKYQYDDHVDLSDKVFVVDWYYHNESDVLHYVKYVDDIVLYATENDPELAERGLYDHGLYPFVFDPLFPIEGSPCGYGFIDIGKNVQARIDTLNQAIDKHAIMGSSPRWFVPEGTALNEEEFADWGKPFVHVSSSQVTTETLLPVTVPALDSNYIEILNNLVVELKETTSNRDTNNGGADSGVTAASAIAALQEQAGKTSKAANRRAYMAYRQLIMICIEDIRQFYDLPRQFRITGRNMQEEFVQLSNAGMQPQQLPITYPGQEAQYRLPVFDIEVSAQKMSTYTKVAQNELALQLYGQGVLAPQNADMALALLDIMDFPHKDLIEEKVRQNGTMLQLLAQYQKLALTLAAKAGDANLVAALSQNIAGSLQSVQGGEANQAGTAATLLQNDSVTGTSKSEPKIVENARAKASAVAQPGA